MCIKDLFRRYLQDESICLNEYEGMSYFRRNELNYLLLEDNDPCYFRLALPRVGGPISVENVEEIRTILNDLNYEVKVGKGVVVQNNGESTVWIIVEQFICSPFWINAVFERTIGVLENYIQMYRQRVSEQANINN